MLRSWQIWGLLFVVTCVVQTVLWRHVPLSDRFGWTTRIQAFATHDLAIFALPTFANPDAAMLTVGAIGYRLGASAPASLRGSTSLLNAAMTATAITVIFLLYPHLSWWLVTWSFLLLHDAFLESAPHDAILAPAVVAVVLLALHLYQQPPKPWRGLVGLGAIFGIALATFLPLSPFFIVPTVLFLWLSKKISSRQLVLLTLITIFSLLFFDPLLWLMPLTHLQAIYGQTTIHSFAFPQTPLPWLGFFTVAPFALASFVLATSTLVFPRAIPSPLPYYFLLFTWGLTIAVTAVLLSAQYKTFRSFHSLIFLWDALLPLFVLYFFQQKNVRPFLFRLVFTALLLAPPLRFALAYLTYTPPTGSL